MATLKNGTDVQATDQAQIDTILPGALVTVSTLLVAGTHREKFYDPTGGSIILTLPAIVDGVRFFIKRVANGGNTVTITGATIDGIAGDLVLSLKNQYIELVANAVLSTYEIVARATGGAGSIRRTTSANFAVTNGFTKYTGWNIDGFTSPGRIVANSASNQIDLQNLRADPQEGFRCNLVLNGEYDQSEDIFVQVVHSIDGVVIQPVAIFSQGSGKALSFNFSVPFGITANGNLSIEISGDSSGAGGTLTVDNATFAIEEF